MVGVEAAARLAPLNRVAERRAVHDVLGARPAQPAQAHAVAEVDQVSNPLVLLKVFGHAGHPAGLDELGVVGGIVEPGHVHPALQVGPALVRLQHEHGPEAVRAHVDDPAGLGVVQNVLHLGPDLVVGAPGPGDIYVVVDVVHVGKIRAAHGDVAVPVWVVPHADVPRVPLWNPRPAEQLVGPEALVLVAAAEQAGVLLVDFGLVLAPEGLEGVLRQVAEPRDGVVLAAARLLHEPRERVRDLVHEFSAEVLRRLVARPLGLLVLDHLVEPQLPRLPELLDRVLVDPLGQGEELAVRQVSQLLVVFWRPLPDPPQELALVARHGFDGCGASLDRGAHLSGLVFRHVCVLLYK